VTRSIPGGQATELILRHWREAVPDDRLAHLVKDATRALVRALQMRLNEQGVSFGHWTFLRVLWEHDGITQRELSAQAGVMEPTTVAALNAMEKLGYIARRQMGGNRKAVLGTFQNLASHINFRPTRSGSWGLRTDGRVAMPGLEHEAKVPSPQ